MSSDGVGEDEGGMEGVQNDVVDLYRMVEELLRLGRRVVGQVKEVGKEVGQCGRRGQEMVAEAPVSGLAITIFLALYVSVALLIMFWWGRRIFVRFVDIMWSGIDSLKREIRESGRKKSRSLPTVCPQVITGGGLVNQNWQPNRGRHLGVNGGVGGDEVVPPGGAGGVQPDGGVQLVADVDIHQPAGAEGPVPAGADGPLAAGAGSPVAAAHLYENILSPIRQFRSEPTLVDEDGYLVPEGNRGDMGDLYSADDVSNVTDKTYVSANMSLRSGREKKAWKPIVKKRL